MPRGVEGTLPCLAAASLIAALHSSQADLQIMPWVKLYLCHSLLAQDQRLIFRLKKQQIVEYLRKGTAEAQQQALGE